MLLLRVKSIQIGYDSYEAGMHDVWGMFSVKVALDPRSRCVLI